MAKPSEVADSLERMTFEEKQEFFDSLTNSKGGAHWKRAEFEKFFVENPELESRICQRLGLPTEAERINTATIEAAEASKRSAAIASDALEVSRLSAKAAQESADAARTMSRVAEAAYQSSERSGWKSTASLVISFLALFIALSEYILNLSGKK